MAGDVIYSDLCPIAKKIPDTKYYCLGVGKLCPGGKYLGGPGDHPTCQYDPTWAGIILLAVLVAITICFDGIKAAIHRRIPKEYEAVVHAFFAELMTLGFVSLVAFLIEKDWDGTGSLLNNIGYKVGLGHELHYMFEGLHFLLFGLSISFIFTNVFLLRSVMFRFRRFRKWSDQIEVGVDIQHVVPRLSKRALRTQWLERRSKADEQEVFLRLYYRFTDDFSSVQGDLHIPENFNFGHYLQINSAKIMTIVTEIDNKDWLTVFLLASFAFIAFLYSRGASSDPDSVDGGYIIFWIYLVSLPLLTALLDWKIHSIVAQLIPVETNNEKTLIQSGSRSNSTDSSVAPSGQSARQGLPRSSSARSLEMFPHSTAGREADASTPNTRSQTPEIVRGEMPDVDSTVDTEFEHAKAMVEMHAKPLPVQAVLGEPSSSHQLLCPSEVVSTVRDAEESEAGPAQVKILVGEDDDVTGVQNFEEDSNAESRNSKPNGTDLHSEADNDTQDGSEDGADKGADTEIEDVSGINFGSSQSIWVAGWDFGQSQSRKDSTSSVPSITNLREGAVAQSNPDSGTKSPSSPLMKKTASFFTSMSFDTMESDELEVQFEYEHCKEEGLKIRKRFLPPYIRQDPSVLHGRSKIQKWVGGKIINLHQNLFWFQAQGPRFVLRALRYLILGSVVMLVTTLVTYRDEMLCTGAKKEECSSSTVGGVFVLLLALCVPLSCTMVLSNTITNFVVATSVEYMKLRESILTVMEASRKRRHLRLVNTLNAIAALVDQMKSFAALAEPFQRPKSSNSGEGEAKPAKSFVRRSFEMIRPGSFDNARGPQPTSQAVTSNRMRASLDMPRGTELSSAEGLGLDAGLSDAARMGAKEIRRSLEMVRKTRKSKEMPKLSAQSMSIAGRHSLDHAPKGKSGKKAKKRVKDIGKDVETQWHEIFMEADQEGNGVLDRSEFAALLQATGSELDDEQVDMLFELMDLNQNGIITFEEFIEVMAHTRSRHLDPEELANNLWELFDQEKTGKLGADGLKKGILKIRPNFHVEQAVELIHYIDIQRKGYIRKSQFVLFVTKLLHSEEF